MIHPTGRRHKKEFSLVQSARLLQIVAMAITCILALSACDIASSSDRHALEIDKRKRPLGEAVLIDWPSHKVGYHIAPAVKLKVPTRRLNSRPFLIDSREQIAGVILVLPLPSGVHRAPGVLARTDGLFVILKRDELHSTADLPRLREIVVSTLGRQPDGEVYGLDRYTKRWCTPATPTTPEECRFDRTRATYVLNESQAATDGSAVFIACSPTSCTARLSIAGRQAEVALLPEEVQHWRLILGQAKTELELMVVAEGTK